MKNDVCWNYTVRKSIPTQYEHQSVRNADFSGWLWKKKTNRLITNAGERQVRFQTSCKWETWVNIFKRRKVCKTWWHYLEKMKAHLSKSISDTTTREIIHFDGFNRSKSANEKRIVDTVILYSKLSFW